MLQRRSKKNDQYGPRTLKMTKHAQHKNMPNMMKRAAFFVVDSPKKSYRFSQVNFSFFRING